MIHNVIEAGCDEAGRGPLAGAVFAAAVVLDPARVQQVPEFAWLNDSKQLTEKQRYALRPVIEREAVSWAVVEVSPQEIDERNILQCSILGMQRALAKLSVRPQHILVDGNKWKPYVPEGEIMEIPADTVVHGDATYLSIAAASVLAKTYRDDYVAPACRIPAIRLGQQQRLSHRRALCGTQEIWHYALPPNDIQSETEITELLNFNCKFLYDLVYS